MARVSVLAAILLAGTLACWRIGLRVLLERYAVNASLAHLMLGRGSEAASLPPAHPFRAHNAPLGITFVRGEPPRRCEARRSGGLGRNPRSPPVIKLAGGYKRSPRSYTCSTAEDVSAESTARAPAATRSQAGTTGSRAGPPLAR